MNKQKLGVFLGRFQPLHNGHIAAIRESLKDCEKTMVLIGSVNKLINFKNPLSTEQRKSTLTEVFQSEIDSGALLLGTINDFPSHEPWVTDILGRVQNITDDCSPTEVNLYTSEKDDEFYRSMFLYPLITLDSQGVNATDFREHLYTGGAPKRLYSDVPQATIDLLNTFIGTEEFRNCKQEFLSCTQGKARATLAHQFNNPIEPVAHAVVIHKDNVLLVQRKSVRGNTQWAIPGGFVEKDESTQDAALRELFEETGVSLEGRNAAQLAYCVEENLDDLSVRTLGINYLFVVAPEEVIDVFIDEKEVMGYRWVPLKDILEEREILFYNHNVVVQRLIATWDTTND